MTPRKAVGMFLSAVVAGSTAAVAPITPASAATAVTAAAPVLNLSSGQTITGSTAVTAEPTTDEDPVVALTVDGDALDAATTPGTAHLSFEMGGNGTEARYHNYVTVNDRTDRVFFPDVAGGQRGILDFPGSWLREGVNTVTVSAGANWVDTTSTTAVGVETLPYGEGLRCPNYDDFALTGIGLGLIGVVADAEQNAYSYSFGDGTCGTSKKLLTQPLTFVVQGDPASGTTGLRADLDSTKLSNGDHTVAATTRSGAKASVTVEVNNDPDGAPAITPENGALLRGPQRIIAAPAAGTTDAVGTLAVDGTPAVNTEALAGGTATLSLPIEAGNSAEAKYQSFLVVNGERVDLGGDWGVAGAETAAVAFPARHLRLGDNTVQVRTGDYNGTLNGATCANHDDFKVNRSTAALALSSAGTVTAGTSYTLSNDVKTLTTDAIVALGDGACGVNKDLELHFDIAGAPVATTVGTLGGGADAHLKVFVGGNGSDAGYDNQVLVNGIPLALGLWEKEIADLAFPNEWLVPGVNTLEFVAGNDHGSAKAGGCDNYDDFTLRDPQLLPAGGTATALTRSVAGTVVTIGSSSYPAGSQVTTYIGDGTCGSSFNSGLRRTFAFDVAGQTAIGRRADLDTTTIADGRHTITATVGGKTSTRRVTVDNSAPEIVSSVPAEGQRLTSAIALTVTVEDATGVSGIPTITLDGTAIAEGDRIGHGLPAGSHTIAVKVTDRLGNTATREIHFSSASIPDVPADLAASLTPGAAGLSARLPGAEGTALTASFEKADLKLPSTGYQGVADSVPTTLDVAHEDGVAVDSLQPLDGRVVTTPSSRDVVFQRYDVASAAGAILRWEGRIDPARVVALRVWDAASAKWAVLTSSRGNADGNTVLTAPAPAGNVAHILVTGEDPFADDLSPHDATAQNDKDTFENPSSYDFSLAHFTDTQYLTEGAAGGTYDDWDGRSEPTDVMTADEQAIWQAAYRSETQWIADNAEQRKIAYTAHTGDVIENDYYDPQAKNADGSLTRPGLEEEVAKELAVSSEYQKILDDNGVVNQVIAGNHDNQLGAETGADSRFSRTFSAQRYYDVAKSWPAGASYEAWDGRDNQNNYVLFSAGGLDFVAVGLSYGVTREEAQWADSIFKRFKDRNGILLSHDYLKPSTSPDGRGATFSEPDGSALYQQVVESNPNVFLVLAGHEHGVGTNLKTNIGATVSHDVVELLADYQFYTVPAGKLWPSKVDASGNIDVDGNGTVDHRATDRLQFGASFLRLLQFDVRRSEMHIDTYSPYLNDFGATEYDIRQDGSQNTPRYNGSEDNLTLPVDLSTRKTSFTTDSLAAYVPSGTIGTAQVTAGQTATTTWTGLKPGTSYAWIVSARSADNGTSVSQPSVFRTAKAVPALAVSSAPVAWGTAAKVTVKNDAVGGRLELKEGEKIRGAATPAGKDLTFTLPVGLAAGTHQLTLAYSGTDQYEPATATVTVTVNAPAAWQQRKVYKTGDRVSYQGKVWSAAAPAVLIAPGTPLGPWQELAMTEDGTAIWTASRIFQRGDVVVHQGVEYRAQRITRNEKPGDKHGPWQPIK